MTTSLSIKCVELKNSIQAKMIADQQGCSDKEIESQIRRQLETSSGPIAQWWRRITSGEKPAK